jgi:hypothetical protein
MGVVTAVCGVLATCTCDTKAPCACAVWGDQIHRLALYTRLSLLLRTLFCGWLLCRNARSTVKLTKMIDFEVSDSNMACGRGLCYRPGGQKAASRGLCGCFLFIHNSQPLLKLSRGRETWLTRQNSVTTIAHAHGALLTDIAANTPPFIRQHAQAVQCTSYS